jgi:dinuclear metal center YbgI/SA1388 family protein
MLASEIIDGINQRVPEGLQESWDNSGLQLGDKNQLVERVMVALEVTDGVIDEAIDRNCQMIVTHHPFFFSPIQSLDFTSFRGKLAHRLIENKICVYSAHTNLDQMPFGISHALARQLGLKNCGFLQNTSTIRGYKLSTFVPENYSKEVLFAMLEAGGGTLRNYTHCSFSTEGIGTFRAQGGARPFLGEVNHLAEFKEIKLEVLVTDLNRDQVIHAMLKAHPYEVAAYDLLAMENALDQTGYGMVGELEESYSLADYAEEVAKSFACPVRIHGDREKLVKTVSCCGGEGADLIPLAAAHSDLYVTGDIRASKAQVAIEAGLTLLVLPHRETEKPGVDQLLTLLKEWFDDLIIFGTEADDVVETSWTISLADR